jgi:very-short-patch-repair endonuclease
MNDLSRVRDLRKRSTAAETAASWLLRNRQLLGLKFRRQCPLGRSVVDFYCSEARLVIELDGSAHPQPSQMKKDLAKDRFLQSMGLRVLRVPNGLVLEDLDAFRRKVCEAVDANLKRAEDNSSAAVPPHSAHFGWQNAGSGPPSPARGEGH